MEAIKVEFVLSDEFISKLSDHIVNALLQAQKEKTTVFTKKEAAAKLRVSVRQLNRYIKEEKIRPSKLSHKQVLIPESEIEQFLKQSA